MNVIDPAEYATRSRDFGRGMSYAIEAARVGVLAPEDFWRGVAKVAQLVEKGYTLPMTEPAQDTTTVSVETPAKTTTDVEVATTPEVAVDSGPDEATQNMEAEPKEH